MSGFNLYGYDFWGRLKKWIDSVTTSISGFTVSIAALVAGLAAHLADLANPHAVTAAQAGAEPADPLIQQHLAADKAYDYSTDFFGFYDYFKWYPQAINAGIKLQVAPSTGHPGVLCFQSLAAGVTGYCLAFDVDTLLIEGSEEAYCYFQVPYTANTSVRYGYHDAIPAADPAVDGVYFAIDGTTLQGWCYSNSAGTGTATTYPITQGVWYLMKAVVNAAGTQVDFYLYLGSTGALVWSSSVAANIPTGAGRYTNHAVAAWTTNPGGAARDLLYLDKMGFRTTKALVR